MNEIRGFYTEYKEALILAYVAKKISRKELKRWSEIKMPGAILLKEGEVNEKDKELVAICEKINFDMFYIDLHTIEPKH